MNKKTEINDLDKAALKEAMKGVKPLIHTKITTSYTASPLSKKRQRAEIEENNTDLFQFSDYETYESIGSDELIEYFRPGIQHKIIHKMRSGQYPIKAKLDLHGLFIDEARNVLSQFLNDCQHNGIRHILIIHGKGRANHPPILKNKLNHWLRQTNQILAFCSAKSKEGGTGALYVLLKAR